MFWMHVSIKQRGKKSLVGLFDKKKKIKKQNKKAPFYTVEI